MPNQVSDFLLDGIVVDEVGSPVANALVYASEKALESDPRAPRVYCRSDRQGRFVLSGGLSGALLVSARADNAFAEEPVVVGTGATDVRLSMERTGRLLVHPSVGVDVPLGDLCFHLVSDSTRFWGGYYCFPPEGGEPTGIGLDLDPTAECKNGRMTLIGLPCGTYGLRAWIDDSRTAIEIDNIRVGPDGVSHDPRLEPLDLSAFMHAHEIRLVNACGELVPNGGIRILAGDSTARPREVLLREGRGTVLSWAATVDLEAFAPGFLTRKVSSVRESVEIQLALEGS